MNIETCNYAEEVKHRTKASPARYALKPGLGAWHLTFAGYATVVKEQAALHYLSYLFTHSDELPIHGLDLLLRTQPYCKSDQAAECVVTENGAHRLSMDARLVQSSFFGENCERVGRMYRKKRELEAVLEDEDETEPARAEALRELEGVEVYLKAQTGTGQSAAEKAVRAVRRSLNRFYDLSINSVKPDRQPNAVLRAFAEHVEMFVLIPSARYSSFRARHARHGKAGCFTYEPPAGVKWQ
jgi:hypothetical protein